MEKPGFWVGPSPPPPEKAWLLCGTIPTEKAFGFWEGTHQTDLFPGKSVTFPTMKKAWLLCGDLQKVTFSRKAWLLCGTIPPRKAWLLGGTPRKSLACVTLVIA